MWRNNVCMKLTVSDGATLTAFTLGFTGSAAAIAI
jgi:hypothetical protein